MRKIRLAVVGPSDSVALINEVAAEYTDRIIVIGYIYADASEVPDLIAKHDKEVDMWVFSGKVPYGYALGVRKCKPKMYIPHTGTSIYRVFLEMLQGILLDTKISCSLRILCVRSPFSSPNVVG